MHECLLMDGWINFFFLQFISKSKSTPVEKKMTLGYKIDWGNLFCSYSCPLNLLWFSFLSNSHSRQWIRWNKKLDYIRVDSGKVKAKGNKKMTRITIEQDDERKERWRKRDLHLLCCLLLLCNWIINGAKKA